MNSKNDSYEQLLAAKEITKRFKTIQDAQLQHIKLWAYSLFPTATKLPEVQFSIEKRVFTLNLLVTKTPPKALQATGLAQLEEWTRHITWDDATIGVSFIADVKPSTNTRPRKGTSKSGRVKSRK